MIFQPADIVVIDDSESHLIALSNAIAQLGSACLSFLYTDTHPQAHQLSGARLIFCDLHLGSDTLTTDKKAFYANIASMLAEQISDDHGPYLLIIWSQFPDDVNELKPYLRELRVGQRPFDVVCLDKNLFIDTNTGQPRTDADLPGAIDAIVRSKLGLAAMLSWERLVTMGARRTTVTLWDLCSKLEDVPQDKALQYTLGRLALGAAGKKKAKENPGHSILDALTPLLVDKIALAETDSQIFSDAVQFDQNGPCASSSQLYTALHFEFPSQFPPSSRGVVSALPDTWKEPVDFKKKFGFCPNKVISTCGYKDDSLVHAVANSSWYLVQMNAACDEAQDTPGYLPYCLAASVSCGRLENGESVEIKINGKRKLGVEQTREFLIEGVEKRLFLFGRFIVGLTKGETADLDKRFRIRGSLLDKLILEIRFNSARLGVVEP